MIEPTLTNEGWKLRISRPQPEPENEPAPEVLPPPPELPPRPGATFDHATGVWRWREWIVPTDKTMMNYLRLYEARGK